MDDRLSYLTEKIREFSDERDWAQYHNAKDLAIGMVTESAELLDYFRFKSDEQVKDLFLDERKRREVSEELADTLVFVLRFADVYDIDLEKEVLAKLEKNKKKYPVEKVKGLNKKYNEY